MGCVEDGPCLRVYGEFYSCGLELSFELLDDESEGLGAGFEHSDLETFLGDSLDDVSEGFGFGL